mmetsp:Transcript_1506/g.2485  ORF Transcript_1506/g.2485 Transcript_1506/m.2485 type:complete len:350 (+) Transcript_1506:102-1151(+)
MNKVDDGDQAIKALEEGSFSDNRSLIDDKKYRKEDESKDNYWRNLKLLFCFLGLQVSYILWGLVQEYLMTKQYSAGKFKSSAFCVFGNRFLALIISLVIVVARKFTSNKTAAEAPYYYYAPCSLSNTLSSWAQYEALKYISFPTQVLSKSCKIIPVMIVGLLLNKKSYPFSEYVEATIITAGVTMFSLSERSAPSEQQDDSSLGVMLLVLYLACDSFTSQWQSRVYKQYQVDQYQMMLGVNVWSMIMTGFSLYQSGEFFTSFAFILADPTALLHMTVLSITSATGQLFIFYTIKEFGPVIFTIMMTIRQILSLFLSLLLFGHSISVWGWLSVTSVFLVVFNRIQRNSNK